MSYTIEGTAYWAQVQKPSQYEVYSLIVGELDEANRKVIEDSNISHRLMEGPDKKGNEYGDFWVQLKRKEEEGKLLVVGPDGKTVFTDLIGNGSKVRVKFRDWQSKRADRANGHKLLAVQVLELVPFGADAEDPNEGDQAFDDMSDQYQLPDMNGVEEVTFEDAQ